MKSRPVLVEALAVVSGFAVSAIPSTYPLVRHLRSGLPNDLGDPLLNSWILAWGSERIRFGLQDVWQAPNFFPYENTLAYSEHLLGIAAVVAPVQWLWNNPILTYNVAFLLSYVLAGSGMYLLVRSITGRRPAGVIAGMAFAFVPYRAAQIPHLQVLMTGWMPIALWALHRYYEAGGWRFLLVFALAFTLQGLSNGYYLYFFAVAVAVIGLAGLVRARRPARRMLVELSACALLIIAVLAPVIYAYYEVRRDREFVRSIDEIESFSADLTSYLHVRRGLLLWSNYLDVGKPEGELFAGATLMTLVAAALVTSLWRRKDPEARASRYFVMLYLAVGLLALVLSLGPVPRFRGQPIVDAGPYRWLMALPGLDGLRVPARFAMIVYLAASVLAGNAAARLLPRRRPVLTAAITGVLSAVILIEGMPAEVRVAVLADRLEPLDEPAYRWIAERPPGGLLELPVVGYEPTHSLLFQYRTLQHGKPIVNGFSGYNSPLFDWFRGSGTPIVDITQTADFFRGLRQIGVRYIALHPGLFGDFEDGQEVLTAFRAQGDQIEDQFETETVAVLQLRPLTAPARWPDDQLARIPAAATRFAASHSGDRLALLADGDPETRWLTGSRQAGGEWIEVRFDETRTIGRIRFEVAVRSQGDYARRLRVEVSGDGESFDEIAWEDAVLPVMVRSVAESRGPVYIDIDLNGMPVRALRLVQLGETRVFYWSVDELSLWEVRAE
jgi:hypothetical protein